MTREETITEKIDEEYKWLMQTKHTLHDIDIAFESIKGFVHDLEQEPCDGCVSRAAVIEWLKDKDIIKTKNQEENARRELAALPPVTPTRKKGKWVCKFHGFPPEPSTVCSECDFDIDFYFHTAFIIEGSALIKPIGFDKIKFCPNCGAEMESEGWKDY